MKKKVLVLLAALLVLVSLVGCANKGNDDTAQEETKDVNLSFFTGKVETVDLLNEIIANYNEQSGGVTVEQEYQADASNIIKIKFASGESPDVMTTYEQEYVDQGATCTNKNIDCTNDLITDTNLNTNKLGSYFYDYIYKIATKFVKITRNIIVNGENYSYILSNSNNTNTDISLSVISNLNEKEFKSITGPDNNTYETDTVIYNITQNGDYIFYINKIFHL